MHLEQGLAPCRGPGICLPASGRIFRPDVQLDLAPPLIARDARRGRVSAPSRDPNHRCIREQVYADASEAQEVPDAALKLSLRICNDVDVLPLARNQHASPLSAQPQTASATCKADEQGWTILPADTGGP